MKLNKSNRLALRAFKKKLLEKQRRAGIMRRLALEFAGRKAK